MNITIELLQTSCLRMLSLSVLKSSVVITNFAFQTTTIFFVAILPVMLLFGYLFVFLKYLASITSGWVELSF